MTNEADTSLPPRLAPDRPFPPYAYVPGQYPHPVRDPRGHSYGKEPEIPEPPDPQQWRACGDHLYGIDLFNNGFYWEAHEAWEGLWNACGRHGSSAAFFQGLIAIAAAGLKVRMGNVQGVTGHARRATDLFDLAARELGSGDARYMGLDVLALGRWASGIAERPPAPRDNEGDARAVVFDFVLRPE